MAFVFETEDLGADYHTLVSAIIKEGHEISPRGLDTHEIENAVIHLKNPRNSLPVGWGRKYSRGILSAELMQWLSGTSDLSQLRAVSKNGFLNYSDDGVRLYGAYGPRAYATLERAVRLLQEDPNSRQAIAVLWGSTEADHTKDLPCTMNWGFRIRNGELHMTTTMRSSDVWRGITYDVTCMTRIGSLVAWALGVEFTDYYHLAHSLHFYATDTDAYRKLTRNGDMHGQPPLLSDFLDEDIAEFYGVDMSLKKNTPVDRWKYARDVIAIDTMDGQDPLPRSFEWFATPLRATPRYRHFCDSCRYWLPQEEMICPATF